MEFYMKKLSLVALILMLLLTLAACNNTVTTDKIARWNDNEHYVYDIYKASFGLSETFNKETFVNEPIVASNEYNPGTMDQLVPENIAGTYTVDIKLLNGGQRCQYQTEQILYVQYSTYTVSDLEIWRSGELQKFQIANDSEENPFAETDNLVTLKSTTITSVEFTNDAAQRPLKSENHVNGFYLGKIASEISKYDMSTDYDWEEKKVTVTLNGETRERALNFGANISVIDANQLLLYVRSLDKAPNKFQDNPSVQAYSPFNDTFTTITFAFSYQCNTVLRTSDSATNFVKLNSVGILANGSALMIQMNLPDTVSFDSGSFDGEKCNKYTTVRFRTGCFAYRLALDTPNYAEIVDAVTVKPAEE